MIYKLIESPDEGELVQYLGNYVTKWRPEFGEPQVAFVEIGNKSMADAQINEQLEYLRDLKLAIAPLATEIKSLERDIKKTIIKTGDMPKVDGVTITVRSRYERTSWDGKALKGYAAAHPEIREFMKVTAVATSVTIKVNS